MDTPDLTTLKRCTKCGEFKTREEFSRNKNAKDGLQNQCKACNRGYAIANKERISERARKYRAANKERQAEYSRAHYIANKERVAERNAANKDHRAKYKRDWHAAHKEHAAEYHRKYAQTHNESITEQVRKYRQTTIGKVLQKAATNRRRARKRALLGTMTGADWQIALDYFGGHCAVCGRPPGIWHTLSADHWIPLSKGGPTTPDNIVPLCHSIKDGENGCNNSKYNRDPDEWVISKFGKRKGKMILKRIESYLQSRQLGIEG